MPNTFTSFPPTVPNFAPDSQSSFVAGSQYVQIPNLPIVVGLDGTEQLETVQAGQSRRVTTLQIAEYTLASQFSVPIPNITVDHLTVTTSQMNPYLGSNRVVFVTGGGTLTTDAPFQYLSGLLSAPRTNSSFTGPIGAFTPDVGTFTNIFGDYIEITSTLPPLALQSKVADLTYIGAAGIISINLPSTLVGSYNLNLPISAGTSGLPLLSGGGGTTPMFYGSISGNTTEFATALGVFIPGQFVTTDASGNFIDSGVSPSGVNPGLINELAYYAASGSTVSGLPTANNGVLITSVGGVPSISSTLPIAVQINITQVGTISVGTWHGSTVTVPFGGTGDISFTLNGVLFGNGINPLQVTAQGGVGTILAANSGAPFFTGSPTLSGTVTAAQFIGPLDGVVGAITPQSGTFTTGIFDTSIALNGSISGSITIVANNTAGTYTVTLPTSPGSIGDPLLSAGGGANNPMTYGTRQGNTTVFGTTLGAFTPGHALTMDASNNIVDSGSPASGTVNPGLINQVAYYAASGSSVSGLPTANNGVLITSVSGIPSISSTLPLAVQTNITELGTIAIGTWTASVIGAIYGGTGLSSGTSGGVLYFDSTTTIASSALLSLNNPVLGGGVGGAPISGTRSGNTTTFGTTTGIFTPGHALTTDASGNIIDSGTPASGTVNPGLINEVAFYASTGSTISGLATVNNGVLVTSAGGVPSISLTLPLAVQTNITELGTITIGVWNGTTVTVPFGGTGLTSGTSGGIPYFNVSNSMASSGLLSTNNPVLGGGVGGSPVSGTRSGNTTTFATTSGTLTSTHVVIIDASGNLIDGGPQTSGSVNPGLINQLAYYATTGSVVSGLSTANNGVLATNGSGVPSITSTLPTAVQSNITTVGTIASGVWNGTAITVPFGGTGDTTLTLNGVLFGNGTSAIQATAQGAANTVLTANAGAPSFSAAPTIGTSVTTPIIYGGTASGSTLTLQSTSGVGATDSIRFMTNGALQFVIDNAGDATFAHNVITPLVILEGSSSGNISILPQAAAGTYNFNLPTTAGTSGHPLLSGGGGASPMTYGTVSGNTTGFVTFSGAFTSGHGVVIDANGNLADTGAIAPTGNINAGTINQIAIYAAAGTTLSGSSSIPFTVPVSTGGTGATTLTANGALYGNGTSAIQATAQGPANSVLTANAGAPSFSASPTIGTSVTTPLLIGGTTGSSTLTLESTSGSGSVDSMIFKTGAQHTRLTINGGVDGSSIFGDADGLATPSSGNIRGAAAAGTNVVGPNFFITPGNGTGTGGSGLLVFQAAPPAASGTTANILQSVMTVASSLGVRIGGNLTPATAQLHLGTGTATAGTSPLKFIPGTNMATPEIGAVEYDGVNLYVTNHSVRRNILDGNMNSIGASTLTTANAIFASVNVVSGENYIFECDIKLTASANTTIVSFNATNVGATNVSLIQLSNAVLTPSVYTNVVVNGGGTTTCPAQMVVLRVTGYLAATGTGTFSMNLRTSAATVALLGGSYFKYFQF